MSKKRETTERGRNGGLSRRRFVGTGAGAVAAGAIAGGFPALVQAADPIRTIGLGVSIINEIQGRAAKDLGFSVRGQALGYGAMFGKMLNQNGQYETIRSGRGKAGSDSTSKNFRLFLKISRRGSS